VAPYDLENIRIIESARKHGISDHDILHAYRRRCAELSTGDPDAVTVLGPSRSGALLELVIVFDDVDVVIHAMPARRRFLVEGWWR
jgi:hypothetical protein